MDMKNFLGLIPLTALLIFTSCGSKTQAVEVVEEAIKIEAEKTNVQNVEQKGVFTATVEAEVTNNIAPQQPIRIKKTYVEVGDHVAKGQKLAEMDAANLNQTKLQMENDKLELDRVNELYKIGGISKSTWDSKKLAYELSKETYDNLLENTTLLSPITGIVTKRSYDSGDMYSMGVPLYVVEQIRPVKLMVYVSEGLYTKVKKGMQVSVTFDVFGDEEFKGTVSLIHPTIDPATRTFPVEVKIANSDERILPGMFARVTFSYGVEQRIVISDRAIQKQSGSAERYVFVCKNGEVQYRKVELGTRIGDMYEVLSGLEEDEVVAITGQNRLNTGVKVEIVNS